ncbi:hypothetical protein AB0H34_02160, partial [Saccharopolyspora shandongensis]|uniref:hypothetical protein n=1 Tax=Saccharopolyspora shandongensis TaxID=418495 RepID=UPI0033E4F5A0
MSGEIEYGPVVVNRPGADLRIGYYDDDHDLERDCPQAIVYYCEPPFTAASGYHFADLSWLAPVDTDSLWNRRLKLQRVLAEPEHRGVRRPEAVLLRFFQPRSAWRCRWRNLSARLAVGAQPDVCPIHGGWAVLARRTLRTRGGASCV